MTIDELCLKIEKRLNLLNTPVKHYLEIQYVIRQTLVDTLNFNFENGLQVKILQKLADKCVPIILEIKNQNISLFKNISHFGIKHQAIKLQEHEEIEYNYDYTTVQEPGALRVFGEITKVSCFEKYLNEINQYEKIFEEILDQKKNKRNSKTQNEEEKYKIDDAQAEAFFRFIINDNDDKNSSLFDTTDKSDIGVIKAFLNSPDQIEEEFANKKLRFNCTNYYVALVFVWFKIRNHIPDVFAKVAKSQIFYSKTGKKPISQALLSDALHKKIKKECPKFEEILKKPFNKKNNLDINSKVPAIVKNVSFRLYEILEKKKENI